MGVLILIIVGILLVWGIQAAIKLRRQQEAENATFSGNHQGWDIYISPHDRGVLALQHESKRIVLGKATSYQEYPWLNITAVEIQKNGQSITQTNRGSQALGAAVGAVLLGPLGLLMGGLSGSKRNKERVNDLSIKVTVQDQNMPVHRIVFFKMAGNGTAAESFILKEPAKKLEHYHALISNALRDVQDNRFVPQIDSDDVSSRIAKLWELRQVGALTEQEFSDQKLSILAKNPALEGRSS